MAFVFAMKLPVEYVDNTGKIHQQNYNMSRAAFIKHMAVAGQRYRITPSKFIRMVGMFMLYSGYIRLNAFNNNRFSTPPIELSDPTETGQFSNLAGKAIADFLSKRIDRSLYTVNYEAALRIKGKPISGERPDLIAYTKTKVFSIEAKGRSANSPGDMIEYKEQSKSGTISVDFSVACISYNLFNNIRCKYHDPVVEGVPFDSDALVNLTRDYYGGLAEFMDSKWFLPERIRLGGRDYYRIRFRPRAIRQWLEESPLAVYILYTRLGYSAPQLILPLDIERLAETGLDDEQRRREVDASISEQYYIDNDRIGIMWEKG